MVLPVRYRSIHLSAAPPRRVVAHTSPPPRIRIRRPPAPSVARTVSAPTPPRASEQDRFNAPLYTLKAFAIATAIVMSSATASVAAVMACLDVRNVRPYHMHPSPRLKVRHRLKNLLHACERGYHIPCRS